MKSKEVNLNECRVTSSTINCMSSIPLQVFQMIPLLFEAHACPVNLQVKHTHANDKVEVALPVK